MGAILWGVVNKNDLNPAFVAKIERWAKPFAFDLQANDGYRSPVKQKALRAMYDKWVAAGRPARGTAKFNAATMRDSIANNPYYSAHNWRVALDVSPVPRSDANYKTMHDTSYAAGLQPDDNTGERWHFQDNRFTFDNVTRWIKDVAAGREPFPAGAAAAGAGALALIGAVVVAVALAKKKH